MTKAGGSSPTPLSYDAWGVPTAGTPDPFGFTGELQRSDTGLQYLRARWYNPATGTLLGRDPFEGYAEQPYSLHYYQYGYSQPTLFSDPSGNSPRKITPTEGTLIHSMIKDYFRTHIFLPWGYIEGIDYKMEYPIQFGSKHDKDVKLVPMRVVVQEVAGELCEALLLFGTPTFNTGKADIADLRKRELYEIKPIGAYPQAQGELAWYLAMAPDMKAGSYISDRCHNY